jgi:hypothetical protein
MEREDGETYVNHPVGYLAHAETGSVAELLFFFFGGVGMVRVTMEPCFEKVSCLLG